MRILFLYPLWGHRTSFIVNDREILSRHFDVTPLYHDPRDPLFPARLARHLRGKQLVFSWFGGIHTAWAWIIGRALGVPQVIVAGGYDVTHLPEIGYGLRGETRLYPLVLRSFRAAWRVLAVSDETRSRLEGLGVRGSVVVRNGVDTERFHPADKEGYVLTVGRLTDRVIALKGLKTFGDAARLLPDLPFRIAGGGDQVAIGRYLANAPSNLKYLGEQPHGDMVGQFAGASVYCQLSYHESFGVALAEAMASGCVPIVTDRGALPEVAGPEAFVVPYGDPAATARAIREAVQRGGGDRFRARAEGLFSLRQRESLLVREIEALSDRSGPGRRRHRTHAGVVFSDTQSKTGAT